MSARAPYGRILAPTPSPDLREELAQPLHRGLLHVTQLLRLEQHPCDLRGGGQPYRRRADASRPLVSLTVQQVWQQANPATLEKIKQLGLVCDGSVEALTRALPLLPELALEQLLQRLMQILKQVPAVGDLHRRGRAFG